MNQETPEPKRVRAVQLGQMLKMKFTPDIQLLGQLIFAKTIGMIAGPRGGGGGRGQGGAGRGQQPRRQDGGAPKAKPRSGEGKPAGDKPRPPRRPRKPSSAQ